MMSAGHWLLYGIGVVTGVLVSAIAILCFGWWKDLKVKCGGNE